MDTTRKIAQATKLIRNAHYLVALTGAGISTRSGIPDFRSPDGLWDRLDPILVSSIYAFRLRPRAFYRELRPLAKAMRDAQPNEAHKSLASLERMGGLKSIITQNIDGLHQKAGSERVLELHGNAREAVCLRCDYLAETNGEMIYGLIEREEMPRCPHCDAVLKPNAVLYGEMLPMRTALRAQVEVEHCDLMLIAGSSLLVSPAAELPLAVLERGGKLIVVNHQTTTADPRAAVVFREDVVEILPRLVQSYGEAQGDEAGIRRAVGCSCAE